MIRKNRKSNGTFAKYLEFLTSRKSIEELALAKNPNFETVLRQNYDG
jgi:hypothetical protein